MVHLVILRPAKSGKWFLTASCGVLRNDRTFNGVEKSIPALKFYFLHTLLDWSKASHLDYSSSLSDMNTWLIFVQLGFNFSVFSLFSIRFTTCVLVWFFSFLMKLLLIKKKHEVILMQAEYVALNKSPPTPSTHTHTRRVSPKSTITVVSTFVNPFSYISHVVKYAVTGECGAVCMPHLTYVCLIDKAWFTISS